MQQMLMSMMLAMSPYMKLVFFVGSGLLLIGLLVGIFARMSGMGGGFNGICYKLAIGVGVFFVACELMGRLLGVEATMFFGSDPFSRALYSNQWPFWTIGAAFLAGSFVVRQVSAQH